MLFSFFSLSLFVFIIICVVVGPTGHNNISQIDELGLLYEYWNDFSGCPDANRSSDHDGTQTLHTQPHMRRPDHVTLIF